MLQNKTLFDVEVDKIHPRQDSLTTSSATLLGLKIVGGKVKKPIIIIIIIFIIIIIIIVIVIIVAVVVFVIVIIKIVGLPANIYSLAGDAPWSLWCCHRKGKTGLNGFFCFDLNKDLEPQVKKGSVADVMGHLLPGDEVTRFSKLLAMSITPAADNDNGLRIMSHDL